MKIKSVFIALVFSCIFQIASAQISDLKQQKIDSIFLSWNTPNHPGGAVGVMKNGEIVFSKAYGLASLEYLVPNTENTIFNIGSVSKQFTAMGIVLLDLQGKLSVDDDIRKYLPELPEFKYTITIRQMLHHTSGLRSLHAMLGLAGWRGDDSRTNADLNRFMLKQKDLNFKPGDEYLYCNTGFMLMVNIIEKVTGEKFVPWMKKSVFEPLGLHHTYVENKYNRIVANNATSYNPYKKGFEREVEYWGYVGSGNVHSTTTDLLKWTSNFYNPKKGWEKAFKMLTTTDLFNNGKPNNYAFGVVADSFKDHNRIQHGGSIGGFRAFSCAYPDDRLNIVVLTNYATANPKGKANKIASVLLKNISKPLVKKPQPQTIQLSENTLKNCVSRYWNNHDNIVRTIELENGNLYYKSSPKNKIKLLPINKSNFIFENDKNGSVVSFSKNEMKVTSKSKTTSFTSFKELGKKNINQYKGTFYSPEFETAYKVYVKNDTLFSHHPRHGDFKMEILKKDVLKGRYPFSIVKYKRDKRGHIIGIRVTDGSARNVWFKKQ